MTIQSRKILARIVLAALLAAGAACPAAAIELQPVTPRIQPLNDNRGIDLQALQSQQRRLDFQARQQRDRQDDRDAMARQRLDMRVPKVTRTCRTETFGNRAVATGCN